MSVCMQTGFSPLNLLNSVSCLCCLLHRTFWSSSVSAHQMHFLLFINSIVFFFKKLLGWHWLIRLCKFQVYSYVIHHPCISLCAHHPKFSLLHHHLVDPINLFNLTLHPIPSSNHYTVVCIWGFLCFVCSFVAFCFMSHIWVKSYGSCSLECDLFCWAWSIRVVAKANIPSFLTTE